MLKSGNLQDFKLTDIINILEQSKKSCRLLIEYIGGSAELFFSSGVLVHASSADYLGEDVVINLLLCKSGKFSYYEDQTTDSLTVNKSIDDLIRVASSYKEMQELFEKRNIVRDTNAHLQAKNIEKENLSSEEILLLERIIENKEISINKLFIDCGYTADFFVKIFSSLFYNAKISLKITEKELFWQYFESFVNAHFDEFFSISGQKMSMDLEKKIQDLIYTNALNLKFKGGKIYSDELFNFPVEEQWKVYSFFLKELLDYFAKIYGYDFTERVSVLLLDTNPELKTFTEKVRKNIN